MAGYKVRVTIVKHEIREISGDELAKLIVEARLVGNEIDLYANLPNQQGTLIRVASIPAPNLAGDLSTTDKEMFEDYLLTYARNHLPEPRKVKMISLVELEG